MLIFVAGIVVIIAFVAWALCAAAGRFDNLCEKEEKERSLYDEMRQ